MHGFTLISTLFIPLSRNIWTTIWSVYTIFDYRSTVIIKKMGQLARGGSSRLAEVDRLCRRDAVLHAGVEVAQGVVARGGRVPVLAQVLRKAVQRDRGAGLAGLAAAAVGKPNWHVIDDDAELDVDVRRVGPDSGEVREHHGRSRRAVLPADVQLAAPWQLGPIHTVARAGAVPTRFDHLLVESDLYADAPRDGGAAGSPE